MSKMQSIESEVGLEDLKAPRGMRYVGLCKKCRDFVELKPGGTCVEGHPQEGIAMAMLLEKDEPRPHLPALNWGALFMPALWGPTHGQMLLILLYPAWIFLDDIIYTAVHAGGAYIAFAALCVAAMLAFTVLYARSANCYAYPKVAAERSLEEYLKRERVWAVAMGVIAVAFVVFATWYNLEIRPGLDV